MNNLEMINLKKLVAKHMNLDEFDLEGIIDNSLDYYENKELVLEQLNKMSVVPVEKKFNEGEVEKIEQQALMEEKEFIEKQFEKGLKDLKKSKTPKLDRFFGELKTFVKTLVENNEIHSLFLIGKCGLGKTFNSLRTLAELNTMPKYQVGSISPLEMYHTLYFNRNKVITFDDTQALLRNKNSMSILMSGLWSPTDKRIVEWKTTSKKLKAPPIFAFKGKIIFLLNELPDSTDMRTLMSRCFYYNLDFTYKEVLELMYEIAKLEHPRLSKKQRFEIVDFIKDNSDETTRDFNLRLQKKIEILYEYTNNWKDLSLTLIKPDEDLLLIKQICEEIKTQKGRIKKFKEETGFGKTIMYKRISQLKERGVKI